MINLYRFATLLVLAILVSCDSDDTTSGPPAIDPELNIDPTTVVLSLTERDCGTISINWSPSTDENEDDIIKYQVIANNAVIENDVSDTNYTINTSGLNYPISINIIAYDNHEGESAPSNSINISEIVNNISFSDQNLKQALLDHNTVIDKNDDNEISECEAFLFNGTLELSIKNIDDLSDLTHFVNAKELDARGNNITDASVLTILSFEKIYMGFNGFIEFNMGNNPNLKVLWLDNNQLASISLANYPNLELAYLMDNQITTINTSNNLSLTNLALNRNMLTQIDVSQNTSLLELSISKNEITIIDVTKNINLERLVVSNNLLSSLYIGENINLERVFCSDNFIEQLDFSKNGKLEFLHCFRNGQLTQLNLKNGNNVNISEMNASQNTNLTCVEVNDPNNIPSGWNIDQTASYSDNCN